MAEDFVGRNEADYAEKMRRADAAARKSMAAALFVTVFFWGAVLLLLNLSCEFSGIPLWFWTCTLGGYAVSVAASWIAASKI